MAGLSGVILHVDDSEANRYVVTRILQNAGYTVVEAATGTAGLKALAEYHPDLVILDVKLPDSSGFDVCRQIKSNPETAFIPVLHLSASFIQSQDKAEGLDSGADAYLTQPVEPIELVATVRSLLRIRQAEEAALASAREWKATFDAIHDSVCLVDLDGKILRCNQATTRLLGKPSSEILNYAHHELLREVWGMGDGRCFEQAKATHQRQILELQSQERWFAKTLDPVLDDQGNFTGAVLILSDITERKQAEALLQEQNQRLNQLMASLQQQTEEAQQANRIKDEFLAVLSHELRSPLNPILGWAKLLQTKEFDEPSKQRALETIERNAKLQTQLIDDLLDVSRILRGKLVLNVSPVNLATVIESALETVRLAAEAKRIQIQTYMIPDSGQIRGDLARLQQIVWNLLSNAVKFTPDGGQIEVQLEKVIGNGSSVISEKEDSLPITHFAQITVTDNGKGIAAEFLPYVFDYFRQEDGKTTRKFGGLGLGLAIVRYLTELHGGTVHAESLGEGQGATFTVRLPLLNTATGLDEAIATRAAMVDLSQLQIVVVDDEANMRELMQVMLEQQGAQVVTAASADEVLMLFDRHPPDILISDVGMPDVDGYMLLREIRRRSPEQGGLVPAIALTAYAGEDNQRRALQSGFQKHIAKPVEPDVLISAIATLVGIA